MRSVRAREIVATSARILLLVPTSACCCCSALRSVRMLRVAARSVRYWTRWVDLSTRRTESVRSTILHATTAHWRLDSPVRRLAGGGGAERRTGAATLSLVAGLWGGGCVALFRALSGLFVLRRFSSVTIFFRRNGSPPTPQTETRR
jgi:hypothetical protein